MRVQSILERDLVRRVWTLDAHHRGRGRGHARGSCGSIKRGRDHRVSHRHRGVDRALPWWAIAWFASDRVGRIRIGSTAPWRGFHAWLI